MRRWALPAGLVLAVGLLAVGPRDTEPILTIPRLERAPRVDGVVGRGEWAGATAISTFLDLKTHLLSPRGTVAFLGYTDKALYVAFRCQGPEPQARRLPKDGKGIWEDDAVEVFLDPGRTLSRHFQFIGNAAGSVWDSIGDDPSWDAKWRFAARALPGGGWEAEFEIPFESLGLPAPREGEVWGLNLARDCKAGGWANLCIAPVLRTFHETERFIPARFGREGEFCRVLSLGRPQRGLVKIEAELPEGVALEASISGKGGSIKRAVLVGKATAEAKIDRRGRYEISLKATKGREVLLRMSVPFEREPKVPLEIVRRFLLKHGVDLKADLRPFEGRARAVRVRLVDKGGRTVKELTLRPSPGAVTAEGFLSTEGVRPGDYKLEAAALDGEGRTLSTEVYDFRIPKRPVWLGSKVGVMGPDEVPWPWTPVEVEGGAVKVWGRSYRLAHWGLPESITSKGAEILAGPVRLEADPWGAKFEADLRLEERRAGRSKFLSEGKFGPLGWRCETTVEFDGMMRFDVELLPRGAVRVERLALVVPLRREHARYLHYWPWGWGKVCTNSFALKGPWRYRFRPIVFLCDEERGLCWFAESDEPLDLERPDEALEVLPQGDVVLLRVNIFDHPVELRGPWRWTFGLQATPVKQVPVAWWLKDRIVHWGSYGLETMPAPRPTGRLVYPAQGNINPMRGTLEAWLKPEFDPWSPEIEKVPLGKRGQFNNAFFLLRLRNRDSVGFYWNADDHGMRFYANIGGKYPIILGAKAPTMRKGKWSHVALVWGDEVRIYVDGRLTCRRKWRGLFGRPVSLEGAEITIGGGGRCDFVVDEIRISDVERDSFDLTKPLERDEHTLLLDRLDCDFEPDGEAKTAPEAGKPGVPSPETAFVKGKFGKGLRLFAPIPPGWERMTYLDAVKAIGARTIIFHEHWTEIQNYYDTIRNGERLRSLVRACHERGLRLAVYFGYEMSDIAPEYPYYAQECLSWKPGMWFYTRQPPQRAYRVCYNSPWADFLAWGIHHALTKYDLDGVYLDGTAAPSACDNGLHGCGYVGKDGRRHPTYPIFAVRELMKRIYKICLDHRGRDVFVNVHNSTGLYIPTLAFATSYWDGEQFAPLRHGQFKPLEIVPLDAFRTEFMGKNAGVPADFLVYPGRPWLYEEALALALLHDVLPRPPGGPASRAARLASRIWRAFSDFGAQEAEWVPYWRSEEFVRAEPSGVYVSLYVKRGRGAIAVASNLSDSDLLASLSFRARSLGLGKVHKAREVLSRRRPGVGPDGTIKLPIRSMRCAVILVE